MTRILQCLVWIIVIAGTARTQSSCSGQVAFPDTEPHNKYPSQENPDNQHDRTVRIKNRATLETKRGAKGSVPVPNECSKKGYCLLDQVSAEVRADIGRVIENVVKSAINKYGDADIVKERFQSDKIYEPFETTQTAGGNIFNLCDVSEKLISPGALQDSHGKWYPVAQDKSKNFLQRFRVEICNYNNGLECLNRVPLPRTYRSRCVQNFAYRIIWVIIDNKMVQKSLKLPSCCSCQIYDE